MIDLVLLLSCRDVEMQAEKKKKERDAAIKIKIERCTSGGGGVQSPQKASKTSGAPCTHHCTLAGVLKSDQVRVQKNLGHKTQILTLDFMAG